MQNLPLNVTIPTYNRADTCLGRAIEGALSQSYDPLTVTVIDDGSTDNTASLVRGFASEKNFSCIRLGENLGTAQAKNVSIMCSKYEAITFHDSDDVPSPHKALLQARALGLAGHHADHILDWETLGIEPGSELRVDVVVGGYDLVKMDGSVHYINKRISLVDDFFPNLQFPSKTEGDWCLINAGLFRRCVFEELGGYLDSVEEDRELRNRTIAAGCVYFFVDQTLLTKIEMSDSLTMGTQTGFQGSTRRVDRDKVWARNRLYRSGVLGKEVRDRAQVTIDLSNAVIEEVINPHNLTYNDAISATAATRRALRGVSSAAQPRKAHVVSLVAHE